MMKANAKRDPDSSSAEAIDPVAKEILFRKYWSSSGWTKGTISASEFAYAKAAALMFDPVQLSHDAVLNQAISMRDKFSPAQIGSTFLASLSTRRLDWRSALGSYSATLHLAPHPYSPREGSREGSRVCGVCGLYSPETKQDISVLSFERLKWGGVRHLQPSYAGLDLKWLSTTKVPEPVERDMQIMRTLVQNIVGLAPLSSPGDIERALQKVLPSNTWERRTLVNILGLAGVLTPRGFPSFRREYPIWAQRKFSEVSKNDWGYPVWAWRGGDGVDTEALRYWFPNL